MDYQIVISPDLNIRTDRFISTWNRTPKVSKIAQAKRMDATAATYIDPELIQQGLIFLTGIAGGIAVDVFKDLVKEQVTQFLKNKFVDKPQEQPRIEVEAIKQTDGAYLLVVKEEA